MDNSPAVNHLSQPSIYDSKSRFKKWLSKILKGGGGGGGGGVGGVSSVSGRHPEFLDDDNMLWRAPRTSLDDRQRGQKDREEVDCAVALSFADDLNGRGGYKWRTDNDAAAARGVQDSLHRPSYPPYMPSYPPYDPAPAPYYQGGYSGCNHEIGYGNYLGCMGTFFHPECFRCRSCGYSITEHEFSLSGRDPYHKSCLKELTHPKCEVCHQFIPTNASGLIEYKCHPYWLQKYCPSHEHDNTARCCSCERLESWSTRYIVLGDGRSVCLECMESAIMDTGDCQPLYHAIRDYYEGLNMRITQQIPMLLVERQALNEAIVGEKNGYHCVPETRGVCLSEEQTVTGILRRPKIGGHRLVGMRTQPHKLTRRCEVTAILVLYGLPRLLTGAILAHELMHGWLRLQGFRDLSPDVEEGICQYLSYMWLEAEVPNLVNMPSTSTSAASSSSLSSKKGGTSEVEQKLGRFFMHQIENDASPAYGGGFRAACAAVNKYGLRSTLQHIRLTGSFPI